MSVLIRQVTLRNYKSIGQCKVDLSGLNVLVGPNGSGKSNFIDALRLVSESLSETLDYAIRQRGGIGEVRRRSGGHPSHFAINLRLRLDESVNASFAFRIGALPQGAFRVQHEQVHISGDDLEAAYYDVQDGELRKASVQLRSSPKIGEDRLYLSAVSGSPTFRPLFDALSRMGFYNINPAEIRELQPHDRGTILSRSGRNLSSVVKRLRDESPRSLERVEDYLRTDRTRHRRCRASTIGATRNSGVSTGRTGTEAPMAILRGGDVDGTLRSLGVLTALFQFAGSEYGSVPLVAIEEPESTVHPAAAATIMDAILEASNQGQVIATTHSPDLLDHGKLDPRQLIAVTKTGGETLLAPVDNASISAIRGDLYTPGELLRQNQLHPISSSQNNTLRQSDLFENL